MRSNLQNQPALCRAGVCVALVLAQIATLVSAQDSNECVTGYPQTCQLNGNCITGCGSVFQRERSDQFCVPPSDPSTQICDDAIQNCCKANIGVIMGVSIGIGAGILLFVVLVIYFTGGGKADKSAEGEEEEKPKEEAAVDTA